MHWWDGDMGAWGWIGMMFMALFWIALIGVIVWAVVRVFPAPERDRYRRESPQEILDARLARGEIDADTYRQLTAELRGGETLRR